MTIVQTLAVFVGIPVLIYLVLAAFTLLPGRTKRRAYQPGQPWEFPAQWWAGDTPVTVPPASALAGSTKGGARGTW